MVNTENVLLLRFDIQSYWHCGSGQGQGPDIDAALVVSGENLPYVPGRTIKGLLRDSLRKLHGAGLVEEWEITELFGNEAPDRQISDSRPARLQTTEGCLHVSNAELPGDVRHYFSSAKLPASEAGLRAELSRAFQTRLAQTALLEGVAQKHSLRSMEVAIPMELEARLVANRVPCCSQPWQDIVVRALPLLRSLGRNRHRGLGRVQVTAIAPVPQAGS